MTRRHLLRIVFGLVLSAICLYFSMREVTVGELMAELAGAEHLYLIPAMVAVIVSLVVRAHRWQLILAPIKRVPFGSAFSAVSIGFMANNVLPMRAGEVVRAVVIGRKESISRSAALATVAVERVFDVLALVGILAIGAVTHGLPSEIHTPLRVFAVVSVAVLAALAVVARRTESTGSVVRVLPGGTSRWGDRVARLLDSFRNGLEILRSPRVTVFCLLESVGVWICYMAAYHWSLEAFALDLPLGAPLLLVGVVSIGVMLPSAPGYLGTMQYFFTLAVEPFGVDEKVAVSASWFYWFGQYAPVTLLGLVYFLRENVSFRSALDSPGPVDEAPVTETRR